MFWIGLPEVAPCVRSSEVMLFDWNFSSVT
jgi:hypothetical protein